MSMTAMQDSTRLMHQQKFQDIINEQHPSIKYTIETEDVNKRLQFLDLDIHNNNGVYEYKIHRKNAITNVQVKPHLGHDPKVLRGIFSGFLHRAYTIWEGQHREEEVDLLVRCFSENGYNNDELLDIARRFKEKQKTNNTQAFEQEEPNTIVAFPWFPGRRYNTFCCRQEHSNIYKFSKFFTTPTAEVVTS